MRYVAGLMVLMVVFGLLGLIKVYMAILLSCFALLTLALTLQRCDGNPIFRAMADHHRLAIISRMHNTANAEYEHPTQ